MKLARERSVIDLLLGRQGGEEDEAEKVEAKEDEEDLFGDDAVEDVAAAEARKAKAAEAQEKAAGTKKEAKAAKTNVVMDVKGAPPGPRLCIAATEPISFCAQPYLGSALPSQCRILSPAEPPENACRS